MVSPASLRYLPEGARPGCCHNNFYLRQEVTSVLFTRSWKPRTSFEFHCARSRLRTRKISSASAFEMGYSGACFGSMLWHDLILRFLVDSSRRKVSASSQKVRRRCESKKISTFFLFNYNLSMFTCWILFTTTTIFAGTLTASPS